MLAAPDRKETRMRAAALIVLLALTLPLAGCATAGGSTADNTPAGLVRQRCLFCHDLNRIKSAAHDKPAWEATVARMRSRGAQLTDREAQTLIDFLSGGGARQM
jgi:hypothetical protein